MLTDLHRAKLCESAIDPDFAATLGVRSINSPAELEEHAPLLAYQGRNAQGILFPWQPIQGGAPVTHIRADHPPLQPDGTAQRYLCPPGSQQVIALLREPADPEQPIVLIEGFKQALAAASAINALDTEHEYAYLRDYGVCAMAGCYGTSKADISPLAGHPVYLILDADYSTKTQVWDAAKRTLDQLGMIGCKAKFVKLPASANDGLDDVLARMPEALRAPSLGNLIDMATDKLGRRPKASTRARHLQPVPDNYVPDDEDPPANSSPGSAAGFTMGKRPTSSVVDELFPSCLLYGDLKTTDDVLMYDNGVYRLLIKVLQEGIVSRLIGADEYVPTDTTKVMTSLIDQLRQHERVAPEFSAEPLLNCPNGMVDLRTGELFSHDPDLRSTIQINTRYNADATCPTFSAWLEEMLPDAHSRQVILEHAAQMLDPSSIPSRHLMLEGPPGTGKSTFLRTMHAIIGGTENGRPCDHAMVESLQLETIANANDKFAIGNLRGKIVNLAGDLAFSNFPDLALWKQLTGEDYISADRKNASRTRFRCRALFIFGMNQFPQVSDSGYFRRVTPVFFGNRITDRIDKTLESRIHTELPGVLNMLIAAWQETHRRGHLLLASSATLRRFEGETNAVRKWFYSPDNPYGQGWHEGATVYRTYCASCSSEGETPVGQRTFTKDLEAIDGVETGDKARRKVNGRTVRGYVFPHRTTLDLETETDHGPDDDPDDDPGSGEPPSPFDDPTPPSPWNPDNATTQEDVVLAPIPAPPEPEVKPTSTVVFDLETGSVEKVFDSPATDFVRLMGWASNRAESIEPPTSSDLTEFKPVFKGATHLIGQNIVGFDLIAMHKLGWFDLDDFIEGKPGVPKLSDTMIMAMDDDPPPAKMSKAGHHGRYSLKNLAERFGLEADKDRLKELAKKHGGYDMIPLDDPTYNAYLKDDIRLTSQVYKHLPKVTPGSYVEREHKIVAIATRMRMHGFLVDTDLLQARLSVLRARKAELLAELQSNYGLPTEGKAPHSSAAGKQALLLALIDKGAKITDFLMTPTGNPALSGDSMDRIIELNPGNEPLAELCAMISELQGQRSVYQTVEDHLHPDNRVHPEVSFRQASGRWSITKPGLSVFGKHTHLEEREIFLPDPGHVLVSADFAQIDARCVAALSQDVNYKAMFAPGVDLHTAVAEAVFNDPGKRQLAKVISHAWNYGASVNGIVHATGADPLIVEEYDRSARARFPGVVAWRKGLIQQVEAGNFLDNGWGRRLNCDPQRVFTQSAGLVGQSCARDIAMNALLRMDREVRNSMRAFVHDEFVFSIPEDKVADYKHRIEQAMAMQWRDVTFYGDAGPSGVNWADCYRKD